MSEETPSDRLTKGSRLLIQDARGRTVELVVEQVDDGTIRVDPQRSPVEPGELVLVEHRVHGDASYRTRAEVARDDGNGLCLLPLESWERDNQRAFVRVRTYGLEVTVNRHFLGEEEATEADEPQRFDMLDVSAGGAAIRAEPRFDLGEELVCHFELPGECCFALAARVVRLDEAASGERRSTIGVEFLGLDENLRSALLRWIFREQARRRRPAR